MKPQCYSEKTVLLRKCVGITHKKRSLALAKAIIVLLYYKSSIIVLIIIVLINNNSIIILLW